MKGVTSIAAGALMLLTLCATTAAAQQSNVQEVTYLTFSHAVELPGVTLQPGTYEFRLADSPKRNVIQVFRKDSREVMGQWTFVQSERPRTTEETVVMFREAPEGTAPAVQFWYFPGEKVGKEFVYPEDQARQIADRTGRRVRTESGFVSPSANADARDPGTEPVGTSGEADDEDDDDGDDDSDPADSGEPEAERNEQ